MGAHRPAAVDLVAVDLLGELAQRRAQLGGASPSGRASSSAWHSPSAQARFTAVGRDAASASDADASDAPERGRIVGPASSAASAIPIAAAIPIAGAPRIARRRIASTSASTDCAAQVHALERQPRLVEHHDRARLEPDDVAGFKHERRAERAPEGARSTPSQVPWSQLDR